MLSSQLKEKLDDVLDSLESDFESLCICFSKSIFNFNSICSDLYAVFNSSIPFWSILFFPYRFFYNVDCKYSSHRTDILEINLQQRTNFENYVLKVGALKEQYFYTCFHQEKKRAITMMMIIITTFLSHYLINWNCSINCTNQ